MHPPSQVLVITRIYSGVSYNPHIFILFWGSVLRARNLWKFLKEKDMRILSFTCLDSEDAAVRGSPGAENKTPTHSSKNCENSSKFNTDAKTSTGNVAEFAQN